MLAFRQLSPVFVPPPRLTGVSGPSIPAYVSAGAWVADCPFCNSALGYTQREQFYFCSNCLNKDAGGQLLEIVWPKNQATIERALQVRPEPDFMHWKPGVSVRELLRQNAAGFHHSWTAPRTWVANEIVTAALLNTHVRDNLLETAVAKVTTAGDSVYATDANALSRLAAGTAGQYYTQGASAPVWATLPFQAIVKSADESVSSSTSVQSDDHFLFSIAANKNYFVLFHLLLQAAAAGDIRLGFSLPAGATYYNTVSWDAAGLFALSGGGATNSAAVAGIIDTTTRWYPFVFIIMIVNGANAGTAQAQWAQGGSDATPTTIKQNSVMQYALLN